MRAIRTILLLVVLPAVITVALLISGLFVGEHILRKRNPRYMHELSTDYINHGHHLSDIYGWEMNIVDLGKELYINPKGYRGKEYDYEKPEGVKRIVMLGDSVAFGFKVHEGKTFSDRLDARYDNLQVLNLCVVGYGTDQELIKLEREGFLFDPDIVIVNVTLENDSADNASSKFVHDDEHPKPYFTYENGELVRHTAHVKMPFLKRLAFVLGQKSILYNRLLDLVGKDRFEFRRELVDEDVKRPPDYELTFRLVKYMHEMCAEKGVRLLALFYPDGKAFWDDGSATLDLSTTTPILDGVARVNMFEKYREKGIDMSNYRSHAYDKRFHMSARGHAVTTEIISEVLEELEWLP